MLTFWCGAYPGTMTDALVFRSNPKNVLGAARCPVICAASGTSDARCRRSTKWLWLVISPRFPREA